MFFTQGKNPLYYETRTCLTGGLVPNQNIHPYNMMGWFYKFFQKMDGRIPKDHEDLKHGAAQAI